MKTINEYINEQINEALKSGYWHGSDAWILDGSKSDGGYTILVGGYSEDDAKKVKKLVRDDKPLGKYEDDVVYAEYDEWKEQNW